MTGGFRKKLASRTFIVMMVIVSLFAADLCRLFYIQVVKGGEYAEKAQSQQCRIQR